MARDMPPEHHASLVQGISRWTLAALVVNCIIGSAVFGLPSLIVRAVGASSPLAVVVAGCLVATVVASYAEVGSRFTTSGGTYLYIREAFGRFMGIQAAWFTLLGAFSARAAAANLALTHLADFWPAATGPAARTTIVTVIFASLTYINCRGVRQGAYASNILVFAKLAPLAAIVIAGLAYAATVAPAAMSATAPGRWAQAMIILFFAFGGFETAVVPTGEAKDPRRDVPFALFAGMAVVTVLYLLVQIVVIRVLPDPAATDRPLAAVASVMWGRPGSALVTAAVITSVLGYLSAGMLTTPRYTYALAENGDFPAWLGRVHPRYRTPYVSIVFIAVACWVLALVGNFSWNVALSSVARLCYYGLVCAAAIALRRRSPAPFRLPGGVLIPALGAAICASLVLAVDRGRASVLAATFAIAALNWWVAARRGPL
jgi:APA family basic amino acid/polyamine antiporter